MALNSADPEQNRFIDRTREALRQGDLLRACDIAEEGLLIHSQDKALAYGLVLACARLGKLDQAMALHDVHGLSGPDEGLDAHSLRARILKDMALSERPPDRGKLAEAIGAYRDAYQRFGDPFPGINAASLMLLAGDGDGARELAAALLDMPRLRTPEGYYDTVTRAEALLILGRTAETAQAVTEGCALVDANPGARAGTRRQLRLIAQRLNLDAETMEALLAPLAPPTVAVFGGQMFEADAAGEAALAEEIDAVVRRQGVGFAYGALAAGADIVIAERLLELGVELNVVLPFRTDDFIAAAVGRDAGWTARFEACLKRAASVSHATEASYVGDPHQIRFGADVAMGMAKLRAAALDAQTVQIAAWDGAPGLTADDVARWRAHGGVTETVVPRFAARRAVGGPTPPQADRVVKAIIFTDFPGFSKLSEAVLPAFWREVMQRIAVVLARHEGAIAYRNTWGDALYAVIDTAAEAAAIALELHDELANVDHQVLEIDRTAGMRIGAHLGPIYRGPDFVTGSLNFFGTEVSRTARIEPITPPGAVYVTEPFAAILALEAPGRFGCDYVGRLELPKAFGVQRMYRLGRGAS
ncbi:TRAFs-binding domain-containing protein [Phenylobacterium sp.]|uniref:TRAFs-binding domain-containing protein n=1 Tax=Phenylobacterium sp. TaxID=1871053 RepID=UPI002B67E1B1|nr:TRAFs-binding domain-containing protein [Phenylobacterium sp.]HLZ74947.1 TRAFs-binding domain-containing protein [Phenylobacterium sp.]